MLACVLFGLILPAQTAAQERDPEGDAEALQIDFAPYYWGPDINANIRLGDQEWRMDEDFDAASLSWKPNVVGATLRVRRESWGLVLDGEALDSDFNVELVDGRPGEIEFRSEHIGLGVLYETYFPLYGRSTLHLTPMLGLRYRHSGLTLLDYSLAQTDEADADVLASSASQWVEPFVSLQTQWDVTPKWALSFCGDADGYSSDQLTWNVVGWLRYHWAKEFSIAAGYRYGQFAHAGGSGRSAWSADGTAQGIIVGLQIGFGADSSGSSASFGSLAGDAPLPDLVTDKSPARTHSAVIQGGVAGDATPKPDEGEVEGSRVAKSLDRGHDFVNMTLDAGVERVDTWMLDDYRPRVSRERSRFFFALDTRVTEEAESGVSLKLKPSVDAKLDLPNLRKKLALAITTTAVDEQPGTDPLDREEGLNVGFVSDGLFLKKTKLKVGVRSSMDLSVALSYRPEWRKKGWRVKPEVRAYYRTDNGEGLIGNLGIIHRIGDLYQAGFLSSLKYAKETDWKVTWAQSLGLAYVFEGDLEDQHRALYTNLSADGSWEDGALSYRWKPFSYRAPLYGKWLYWELGPEIVWKSQYRWEPEPSLRFAVSSLFWGTPER
jgi:hypothetical protein